MSAATLTYPIQEDTMDTIETFDVQSIVVETVATVFDTMLGMKMELIEQLSQSHIYGSRILGSINLVGKIMGIANIQIGSDFARAMTATMLDLGSEESVDEEAINDVVGEVCNMISGSIKSSLCDAGMDCALSTPALTRGKNYSIKSSPMSRSENYVFYHGDDLMLVEVGLKLPDRDMADEDKGKKNTSSDSGGQVADFNIGDSISPAVSDVFDTMLDMDVQPGSDPPEPHGQERIVGSISLSGLVQGRINIEVTESFSRRITATMLDLEEDEIEGSEEIRDVIGEVCNMISGTLKSDLCDAGLTCLLSPPAFTAGNNFQMENLYLPRQERFVFYHGQNPIVVEVGLKASDPAA
jgi:CheY-specific phosphatase CheX